MSVADTDRAALPEREGSPSPAPRVYGEDSLEVIRAMAQADAEYKKRMEAQMAGIQWAEWTLFILTGSLLAGMALAWVVDRVFSGGPV